MRAPLLSPVLLLAALAALPPPAAAQAQSQEAYEMQAMRLEIQRLRVQIETLQRQLAQVQEQQQQNHRDLLFRIDNMPPPGGAPGAASTNASAESIYSEGVNAFTRGHAQEALRLFTSVQAEYPDSGYAARSLYWMGEAYEVMGDTVQAEQSYQALLERYPDHDRSGHAAYKLALLHHRQAREARAWCLLQRALRAPEAQVSALASAYIRQHFDPPPSVTCPP